MHEPLATIASSLPVIAMAAPFLGGVLVFLLRRGGSLVWSAITLVSAAVTAAAGAAMIASTAAGNTLVAWGEELRVDALSALLVGVIGGIGLLTVVYAPRYVRGAGRERGAEAGIAEKRLPVFYGLVLWFLATMVWGCVTNNIVMLYVAVEATTLTSGLLVAFLWDRRALEAGYKYLMLLTIGITFALVGCVLTYAAAAATGQVEGVKALLISDIRVAAPSIPRATALLSSAFLIVGFGTKAGLAPFHPWLPDAHAEAPTPVSVLLSGVMIKMALYAMIRTVGVFYPEVPQLALFIVALGVFTMVLGIVMAFTQDDLKRLLAYSSVSQMGYVVVGIGLGTYLGCYGGLFHLLNHAMYKALLFMCVGAVIYATGVRKVSQLGALGRRMPLTSACFFVGALAIAGFPPLNGFMSKLTIYLALAQARLWWAAAAAVLTAILTMVVLVRAAVAVFWRSGHEAEGMTGEAREVPATMWVPMVALAVGCVVLGVVPQAAHPLLSRAAVVLAALGR